MLVYLIFKNIENTFMIGKNEEIINIFKYLKYTIIVFCGVAIAPAFFKLFKLA